MPQDSHGQTSPEWAALFYLCGHYNRSGEKDAFVAALQELTPGGGERGDVGRGVSRPRVRGPAHRASARRALGAGVPGHGQQRRSGEPRAVSAVGVRYLSGPPLRPGDGRSRHHGQPIRWSDARRSTPRRLFAICDDRATNDAIELHELSATLKAAFPADGLAAPRDARVRHVRDAVHGGRLRASRASRPAGRHPAGRSSETAGPLLHWPYARLLQRWQEIVATPIENAHAAHGSLRSIPRD